MAFRKSTFNLFCIVLAVLLLLEAGVIWHVIKDLLNGRDVKLSNFQWVAAGVVLFVVIRHLIIKLHWPFRKGTGRANLEMIETFMHELTHQMAALFLGRRLHSFHAEQHSGVVYTSGSEKTHLMVALAPYCLPWCSLVLVMARVMIRPEWIWLYDIILGLSIGFHGVCIYKDTRKSQSDINQFPLYFSFMYIAAFLILNITIILISVGKNCDIVKTVIDILNGFGSVISSLFN